MKAVKMKSKKAQVFILMALAIASILAISFGMYSYTNDRSALNQRINTMNSFISSTEKDISRQLYIAAYRAVFVAETDILKKGCVAHYSDGVDEENIPYNKGECINDENPLEILLGEMFFDETTKCEFGESSETDDCIDEKSLIFGVRRVDLIEKEGNENSLQNRAREFNIDVNTCPNVASPPYLPGPCGYTILVDQIDPWHVRIRFDFDLKISDKNNIASWNKRESITALVPIANFYDPLYITQVSTSGSKIAQTIFLDEDGSFIPENLVEEMRKGYYIADNNAPDFLTRLKGKTTASENGISRIIDISALMNEGKDVSAYISAGNSIVDYQFFSGIPGEPVCPPAGVSVDSWFKLDELHAELYNVAC